jgi:hypothetical protein
MPPQITWLEITVGGGLFLGGILLCGSVLADSERAKKGKWIAVLAVALFFIPLVWGLYGGNSLENQVRDLIPLLFLLAMPILLLLMTSSASRVIESRLIAITLIIMGFVATIIYYWGIFELFESPFRMQSLMSDAFSHDVAPSDLFGWATLDPAVAATFIKIYDPAVLFAGILFFSVGIVLLVKSWLNALFGLTLMGCGVTVAYGFMILGLRAHSALMVLAVLCVCVTQIKQRGFYTRVVPLAVIGIFIFWTPIISIIWLLLDKHQMVGSNGKAAEWQAVISTISASPQTLLLGLGWGGTFDNPVYREETRFTHSIVSFYLLKSGVAGVCMLLLMVGLLLRFAKRIGGKEPWDITRLILLVSCLPPLFIGLMLQPTYKMLSYGLILALFLLVVSGTQSYNKTNRMQDSSGH